MCVRTGMNVIKDINDKAASGVDVVIVDSGEVKAQQ